MTKSMHPPIVVIPNLNGGDALVEAVDSLVSQSLAPYIIVVDNASSDDSVDQIKAKYPDLEVIQHHKNKGYAGGVNPGLQRAIELGVEYVAPFNDDAIADKRWLQLLVAYLDENSKVAAAAPKVLAGDHERLDSTGDYYTIWGLPYPRGRREYDTKKYDHETEIFAASGAASLYRVSALKEVGLFDEDFFAYYEDVDLSFRLQLAGWKVAFVPSAVVYHRIGMTSGLIKGFTTYQTVKNLPLLMYKNVPKGLLRHVWPRLFLAQLLFTGRAFTRGHGWPATKGHLVAIVKTPKILLERRQIQSNRKVSVDYIAKLLVYDLPPNARSLRSLRSKWWKLRGRHE
jgi:GT2 family glycosyltransferase